MMKIDDPVRAKEILKESQYLIEESWRRYDDMQGLEEELRLELMELPNKFEHKKAQMMMMYSKFIQAGEKIMKSIYRMSDRQVRFAEMHNLTSAIDMSTRACAESYQEQLKEVK